MPGAGYIPAPLCLTATSDKPQATSGSTPLLNQNLWPVAGSLKLQKIKIMTGEEKRKILKEQYKQDLIKRREFLEKTRKLQRLQKMNQALSEMKAGLQDDSDEWIDQLNQETALTEAKLEISMEEAAELDKKIESINQEAEMERINAENLILEMKRQMGLLPPEEETTPEAESDGAEPKAEEKEDAATEKPETELTANTKEESTEEDKSDESGGKTLGDF